MSRNEFVANLSQTLLQLSQYFEMVWKPETFLWHPRFMVCIQDLHGSCPQLSPKTSLLRWKSV